MKPDYSFDQRENTSNNPEHFAFNLGAFVSAGRSVTLVMQKEFKSWYDKQKQADLGADENLSALLCR